MAKSVPRSNTAATSSRRTGLKPGTAKRRASSRPADASISRRISALDWNGISADLDERGYGLTGPLLTPDECRTLVDAYDEEDLYRSRVVMARHNYGRGEYRYFRYPLPSLVRKLRDAAYARLAPVANRWSEATGADVRYPPKLSGFLKRCHEAGQLRPTPLILKYGPGDYNCLHQDLYGELHFPLQVAVLLSRPGKDFRGGEFVLTEQRPRMQSRVRVVPLAQGEAVIFAVNQRPQAGQRGFYRVTQRHGVSELRSGRRHTLGIIFHDAK